MIELVAGGARSGKSRFALQTALATGKSCVFVATAQAGDDEFAERIERHRAERGSQWQVVEEPRHLCAALSAFDESHCVLIDCLTLWVTNWLVTSDAGADAWRREREAFLKSLSTTSAHVIMVTNEVGQGVVPMGELSRRFVDESGWLHQAIAALADRVVMVNFGLPQTLKPIGHNVTSP